MSRIALFITILAVAFYGCRDKMQTTNHPTRFKSFEISYISGGTRGFSFIVDTTKIYFSSYNIDTTYYGILPDTIFASIDTLAFKLLSDTSQRSTDDNCCDCDVVAIQIATNNDTIKVCQAGTIDKQIWSIINSLQRFIDNGKHEKINAITFFETRNVIVPPPPTIYKTSFKPAIVRKKSDG